MGAHVTRSQGAPQILVTRCQSAGGETAPQAADGSGVALHLSGFPAVERRVQLLRVIPLLRSLPERPRDLPGGSRDRMAPWAGCGMRSGRHGAAGEPVIAAAESSARTSMHDLCSLGRTIPVTFERHREATPPVSGERSPRPDNMAAYVDHERGPPPVPDTGRVAVRMSVRADAGAEALEEVRDPVPGHVPHERQHLDLVGRTAQRRGGTGGFRVLRTGCGGG